MLTELAVCIYNKSKNKNEQASRRRQGGAEPDHNHSKVEVKNCKR